MLQTRPERKSARWDPRNLSYGPDKIYVELPGTMLLTVAPYLAPSKESIRESILALRAEFKWTQSYAATVFGVPLITFRSWEYGSRSPKGASRKLIWLLSNLLLHKGRIRTDRDVALWGDDFGCMRIADLVATTEITGAQPESQASGAAEQPSKGPQMQP